jgi:beta-glucosidase
VNIDAQHEASRAAAEGSIVLLKNEGNLLPLKRGQRVAVIGAFAHQSRFQGDGSSAVNPTKVESALACLRREGVEVLGYEAGFSRLGKRNRVLLRRAKALARQADVVLLYLGLEESDEGEGVDRAHLRLPHCQIEALEAVAAANPNVAVVLSCGSPIEMPWLDKARALLHGYLGGQAGAWAAIRALTGEVNPSGKLAETYPQKCSDGPTARSFLYKISEYREGLFVGYRHYDSAGVAPLFPFGFGLSYTSFEYSDFEARADGVSFTLTNAGERDGAEVAQLYIGLPAARVFRPRKELKGFKKVFLRAHESARVFIPFDDKTFRYYNVRTRAWEIEGGDYSILVGASSADIRLEEKLCLKGSDAPLPYEPGALPSYYSGRVGAVPKAEFERLLGRKLPSRETRRRGEIGLNDAIMNCRRARSALARATYWFLTALIWVSRKTGRKAFANDVTAWAYQMPFRGLARLLSGRIDEPMLEGILLFVNGKHSLGLVRLYRAVREKERNRLRELLGRGAA